MDIKDRLQSKQYKIIINGISCFISAQSIGEALTKASVLRLTDKDTITVKFSKE